MAIPANLTPETATVIATLPFDETLDVADAPIGTGYVSSCDATQYHQVWYVRTTGPNERQLIFSTVRDGAGNYAPRFQVWSGVLGSLTQYVAPHGNTFCKTPGGNYYVQVPVAPNTTYYLQINDANNTNPVGSLRLRMVAAPALVSRAGDLLISDDTAGFPGAVIDQTTGGRRQYPLCPPGEFTDTLPTGELCFEDANSEDDSVVTLTDQNYVQIAQHDFVEEIVGIKSDRTGTFYVITKLNNIDPQTVHTISKAGVVGGTTWTLPADSANAKVFAVTRDGATLYYGTGATNTAIHAYDLNGSAPLADLHAGFANEHLAGTGDGYVDEAGNILFAYADVAHPGGQVRRFDAAGTVLDTYNLAHTNFAIFDHFCLGIGTGLAQDFWAWAFYAASNHLSAVQQVILDDASVPTFLDAIPVGHTSGLSDTVDTPYFVSESCPIVVLTQNGSTPPPGPGTARATRRLRRFPLPWDRQFFFYLNRIEFVLQAGEGNTTDPGKNPVIEVRFSPDSGRTWGNWLQVAAGPKGKYLQRAVINRVGKLEQGYCELVVSAPIAWNVIDVLVDGTWGGN